MFRFKSFEGGMMKVTLGIIAISIVIKKLKFVPFDWMVLFYCFYALVSFSWFPLPKEFFVMAIENQLYPISMFYIARLYFVSPENFLRNMRTPLLIAFACALYLYFFQPSWYLAYKTSSWTYEYSGENYFEHMRLSGFWPWSYFIGYSSLFLIMYETTKRVVFKEKRPFFVITIVLSGLVLFFAQQRVSIVYLVVFLFLLLLVFYKKKLLQIKKKIFFMIAGLLFVGGVVFFFIAPNLDNSYVEYVSNRSFSQNSTLVADRFGLYAAHYSNISFFGDGLGSHSHTMRNFAPKWCISDCDYVRLLNEVGVFGTFLLGLIIFVPFVKKMKYFRELFFEYNLILFLLIAMIGATPLEHLPLHPYIYWFCLGKIVVYSDKSSKEYL